MELQYSKNLPVYRDRVKTPVNMRFYKLKNYLLWWLTFVILATWEAEIRRITIPGQLRQS
jgi:hypothetical protein